MFIKIELNVLRVTNINNIHLNTQNQIFCTYMIIVSTPPISNVYCGSPTYNWWP